MYIHTVCTYSHGCVSYLHLYSQIYTMTLFVVVYIVYRRLRVQPVDSPECYVYISNVSIEGNKYIVHCKIRQHAITGDRSI